MFVRSYQKITIIRNRLPQQKNVNDKLQWLGSSLGLFGTRDKDKSCFRIFLALLKKSKTGQTITSDQLAAELKLSRGTVVHHLKKLIEAGIIIHDGNSYLLRVDNLERLIEELRRDLQRTIDDMSNTAKEIDKWLMM